MAELPLNGSTVLIDDSDIEKVSPYNWRLTKKGYVECNMNGYTIGLHRFVMGLNKGDRFQIDHINHNPLDNRKSNLRIATYSQNQHNRKTADPRSTSGIPGVGYKKDHQPNPWYGRKIIAGNKYLTAYYATPEAAKEALDAKLKDVEIW